MGVHKKIQRGNIKSRNFGTKTRCLTSAMSIASRWDTESGETFTRRQTPIRQFGQFLMGEGIRDLRKVTKEHVIGYTQSLIDDGKSASTVKNYLSDINQVMMNLREDKQIQVDSRDMTLPKRSYVALTDKSALEAVPEYSSTVLQLVTGLQAEFGLRIEEAIKVDATQALVDIQRTGFIKIAPGTKGGRPREVPAYQDSQREIIKQAAHYQRKDGNHNFIPHGKSENQFINQLNYELKKYNCPRTHQYRHKYINDKYEEYSGCKSQVRMSMSRLEHLAYIAKSLCVTLEEARVIDYETRLKLTSESGHGRVQIISSYIGGRR